MKINPIKFALIAATGITILVAVAKHFFSNLFSQDIFVPNTPRGYADIPNPMFWNNPLIEMVVIFLAAFAIAWIVSVILNNFTEKK